MPFDDSLGDFDDADMIIWKFSMPIHRRNRNKWFKVSNQSLQVFLRNAGFDLAVYDRYSAGVQTEARRAAIREAMYQLEYEFEEETKGEDLKSVEKGVYVISLSGGMRINYAAGKSSPIVYIGQGAVFSRIKSHYDGKLFDFMMSLGGVSFDFRICEPWKSHYRRGDFHKQVEYSLISEFEAKFGTDDTPVFPLMNRISGSNRDIRLDGSWWRTPLKLSGTKVNWLLEPGKNSGFFGSLD